MNRIVAAVDFSDLATQVIEQSLKMAKAFGGEVKVLHVQPPAPAFIGSEMSPPVLAEQHTEEVKQIHDDLKSMVQYLEEKGIKASYTFLQGPIIDSIVEISKEYKADLLILGAHSHGFLYRAFIGSISIGVLKISPCPVMVIPEK
jgi:nucleotide-binding universal stress UspA family protein